MPKALSQYQLGMVVILTCYHTNCEDAPPLQGELAEEVKLWGGFHGSERVIWRRGTPVRAFKLKEDVRCAKCKSNFRDAIIVSRGRFIPPTIIGYEPEPA